MKLNEIRWIFLMVLSVTFPVMSQTEEEGDDLPQAEPYRQPMRPSFNRGNLGGVAQPSASYDISKTFDSMTRKSSADNRMGDDYNKGGNSRLDSGYSDSDSLTRDDYYDPYASESGYGGGGGYGGYASESGYGLSCASGYVNASAVALLAFLFLLNIVQDIVEQIQTGRRRRDVEEESDLFSFVNNGGMGALKEGLPSVVLPLMVDLMEATEAPHCLQRPLCEANHRLSADYGVVGKVVGSLLSNVVSKAFSGDDAKKFHMALQASSAGRSREDCSAMFPSCGGLSFRKSSEADISNRDKTQTHQPPENANGFRQPQPSPQSLNHNHVD